MDVRQLWDFSDPVGSRVRFEAALEQSDDPDQRLILRTQIARTHSLSNEFIEAHACLDLLVDESSTRSPEAQSSYWLERGRTYNSSGDKASARECFEHAKALDVPGLRVDALHMLAIAGETTDDRIRVNREALAVAEASEHEEDRRWRGALLNNLGWDLFDAGQYGEALEVFEAAVHAREEQGEDEPLRIARWCVARCLRALDRPLEALAIQRELKETGPPDRYVDEEIAVLEGH